MQLSFATLWDGYKTDADAKKARDTAYWQLKKEGKAVKRTVLRGQIKPYADTRGPGGICDVYILNVED